MHNPFHGWRVTDTWRRGHLAVDYGQDAGVPFGAPAAGVYRHDGPWRDAGIRGVLTLDDGRLILFCHLSGHLAAHGQWVSEGQALALIGNTGASKGPHMHTYGLTAAGARWDWTRDTGPRVATLTAPTPFPLNLEHEDMHVITVNNTHDYAVAGEFISHLSSRPQSDITVAVTSASDEVHRLPGWQFLELLDGLGVPRDVVDLNTGAVLNPQSGTFEGGGVWSRRRQAVALLERMQ